MPKIDTDALKTRIEDYLNACGVEINTAKRPPLMRCPSPDHSDEHPSAVLYPERVYCPVCAQSWDIFDLAGFRINSDSFVEKKNEVMERLSIREAQPPPKKAKKEPPKRKKNVRHKPISKEKAKELFNRKYLTSLGVRMKWGNQVVDGWQYLTPSGDISIVEIRFENPEREKAVISFWSDGDSIFSRGCPVELYNQDQFKHTKKPVLIVEGAKCADAAAKELPGFMVTTWNGGAKKVALANWAVLSGRVIYIYPDDDQQKYKNGKVKPWHLQPGFMAALEIKKALPGAKIVEPIPEARELKASGADIVEAFQCRSGGEMAEHIVDSEPVLPPDSKELAFSDADKEEDKKVIPFKILGTTDDGRFFFIGRNNRLIDFPASSISKTVLLMLAPLEFWMEEFGYKGKISWDQAIDKIISATGAKDFDPDIIRGRGAWRNPDQSICFHDGEITLNKHGNDKIYLRKTRMDLGLDDDLIDFGITDKIASAVKLMSFETHIDCERLLGWSALAPFCGALPWRPAILLTGESGSGKTTAIDRIVRPLALPEVFSGGESTEAGIRQRIGVNAAAIVVEEAETDTPKKKMRREDIFSLMRQSTSDNAPRVAKGTTSQKSVFFSMRSIFLFAAISPEVESVADDNRIFRINMIRPTRDWSPIRTQIDEYMTPANCRKIRSTTWLKLQEILDLATKVIPIIQDKTNKDTRYCLADGLLFAAYRLIWQGNAKLDDREIDALLEIQYTKLPVEETRDETDELIDRLLDERTMVEHADIHAPAKRELLTLREILIESRNGSQYMINLAARYGLRVDDNDNLAIAINHHEIMKILNKGRGYHRQLIRHSRTVEKMKVFKMAGKARRCVTISDVIDFSKKQEKY